MEITIEDLKPYLEGLTSNQKDKLLVQLLKKDPLFIEQLYFKHLSTPEQIDERYADFEEKVVKALAVSFSSIADELDVAKAIGYAKKVINTFTKIDKRPEKEADLLVIILDAVFMNSRNPAKLGTCWTKYDLVVTQTLKRLITILKTKVHEDYWLDYKSKVDTYLARIKSASDCNDFVYELPDEL